MNKRSCFLLSVFILTSCLLHRDCSAGQEPDRGWKAYWLTGGPHAETGYGWLLLSRLKLEELVDLTTPVKSFLPQRSQSVLDAPAIWIETNSRTAVANSDGMPIKIAPAVSNYRMAEQKVKVGDFDFVVEAAPIPVVINLLKNPGGKIHRPWPPFYGMENTSKALLALLEAESSANGSAEDSTSDAEFNAYALSGGNPAGNGNRWLFLSQFPIEDLVVSDPSLSQEKRAVWVLTHGVEPKWEPASFLQVPPPVTKFVSEQQVVWIGGVEYSVEAIPFEKTIALLQKEQERALRSSIGPLYISNPTARALKVCLDAAMPPSVNAANPTTLMIASSFGGDRSVIASSIGPQDPRSGILHGLQVTLGAEKRLRELAVYDNGFLERRETYIEDGFELVHEQFIRTTNSNWHNGNGYRRVESKGTDGSKATTVAEGYLLDNQPWHGTFVFIEHVPDDKPFESIHRLILRTYSEGKLVSQTPDVTLGFGAKEQDENWLLNLPEVLKDK